MDLSGRIVIIGPSHPAYDGLHRCNQTIARLMREQAGQPWVERAERRRAELQRRCAEMEASAAQTTERAADGTREKDTAA